MRHTTPLLFSQYRNIKKAAHKIWLVSLIGMGFWVYLFYIAFAHPTLNLAKVPMLMTPNMQQNLKENTSKAILLMDADTGQILLEKNAHTPYVPASLTKMMTLYIIYESISYGFTHKDALVPISPLADYRYLPYDATKMYLMEGEKATLKDLMLGLAVASGNDAAIATAEYLFESVPKFVDYMNYVSEKLGLQDFYFEDPHGLSSRNMVNAKELAIFSREYLKKFPYAIDEIHAQKSFTYPNSTTKFADANLNHPKTLRTTNPLLRMDYPGVKGLKTGNLFRSGKNIILTLDAKGRNLILVLLGTFGVSYQGEIQRTRTAIDLFSTHLKDYTEYHPALASQWLFDSHLFVVYPSLQKIYLPQDSYFHIKESYEFWNPYSKRILDPNRLAGYVEFTLAQDQGGLYKINQEHSQIQLPLFLDKSIETQKSIPVISKENKGYLKNYFLYLLHQMMIGIPMHAEVSSDI